MLAQVPIFKLDLKLEQRFGSGSSVDYFVARGSHLYFVCRTPNGFVAVITDAAGGSQSSVPLGTAQVAGFDVDSQGKAYVLAGNRVTVYDSRWGVEDSFPVDPPAVVALAAVGGRLMGIHENGRLNFLKNEEPAFTMEAYPAPWILFSAGEDRLGIFRPEAGWWHTFQIDGEWSYHSGYGRAVADLHAIDTAGADDKLYILGAEKKAGAVPVMECEMKVGPRSSFELQLADGFHPKMIRLLGEALYLADRQGTAASYDLASALKNGRIMDHAPALLSETDAVRAAVAKSGYTGRFTLRLSLSADGSMRDVRTEPAGLASAADANAAEVMRAIVGLRFQPKTEAGRAVASPVSLELGVP
jgi:hypothetical protein